MGRNLHTTGALLLKDIPRARMVHWCVLPPLPPSSPVSSHQILTYCTVAYSLGIYLLNLFLAFLQPKFDPSNEAIDNDMEDGAVGGLPTKQDEEFKPFIRRLPEFKFWHSAIAIGFACTWFSIFDVPVFWPVLVVYWLILFTLTSKLDLLMLVVVGWKSGGGRRVPVLTVR
jgi:hypothetical protein